ncbi:MAG: GIY-YIG nuclease family protein [Candidatus Puniceispirillum sp.]
MQWVVYILECADHSLYTGITNDLDARIAAHMAGTGAKYTKGRGPFTLIYHENCQDRSHASQREYAIKALPRHAKLALYATHTANKCHADKA